MSLTDFLLARVAEDEERAGALPEIPPDPANFTAGHVVMHPARFLTECQAKREIVTEYVKAEECALDESHDSDSLAECAWRGQGMFDCLHLLATVYADHPDYLEEWKP